MYITNARTDLVANIITALQRNDDWQDPYFKNRVAKLKRTCVEITVYIETNIGKKAIR